MSLLEEKDKLKANLRNIRQAILGRGGELPSATAGLKDLAIPIFNIPADTSLAFYEDSESAYEKTVPASSEEYAMIKRIGGKTTKQFETKYGVYSDNPNVFGLTITNEDNTIRIKGTYKKESDFEAIHIPQPWFADDRFTYTVEYQNFDTSGNNAGLDLELDIDFYEVYEDGNINDYSVRDTLKNLLPLEWSLSNIDGSANETLGFSYIEDGTYIDCAIKFTAVRTDAATLADTKVTALVSKGSNVLDFEAALKYWRINYQKNGEQYTIDSTWGNSFNKPYKFTETPDIYTISVSDSSQGDFVSPRITLCYFDGKTFTRGGNMFLGGANSFTPSIKVNAFELDYGMPAGTHLSLSELRINKGTESAPYKPYRTEPVDTFEVSAELIQKLEERGCEYGKSFNYIDFVRKVFVDRYEERTDLDSLVWGYSANYGFFCWDLKNIMFPNESEIVCDRYTTDSWSNVYGGKTNKCIASSSNGGIIVSDSRYTNEKDFKASLAGVKLAYPRLTPIETDISDILPVDTFIKVEGAGTITVENEKKEAVPTTIKYVRKVN